MIKAKLLLFANWLFSFRVVFLVLAAAASTGIVYAFIFLTPVQQDKFVMPSFLAFLWSIMLYTLLVFTQQKPQNSNENITLLNKFKLKVHRLFYSLFTVVFIGLTLAVFIVTFRLLSVWY